MRRPLNVCFAPHTFVDEYAFITKQKNPGLVYQLQGVDPECLTDETLESLAQQQLHPALNALDQDLRCYQYVLKERGCQLPYHRAAELYSIELYWALLLEQPRRRPWDADESSVSAHRLHTSAEAFENATRQFLPLERLKRLEAFRFLRRLACLTREEADRTELPFTDHVDYWMGQHSIVLDGKRAWIRRPMAVLTLRELPAATYPNVLGKLIGIEADFILCSEFKRVSADRGADLITKKQDFFHQSRHSKSIENAVKQARQGGSADGIVADASVTENVSELGKALVRVKNGGEFLGEYSLTLVLHASDPGDLAKPIAEARQIVGAAQGVLRAERFALDPYLAVIPGNTGRNFRRQYLTSANYADLSLMYAPAKGEPINKHLNREHLVTVETNQRTPFCFNLHVNDLLAFLLFGIPGAGKSFAANLLIDHYREKYGAFIFIMDVGGSYRQITRKHKGSYVAFSERKHSFAPFALERTPNSLEFLSAFVHLLLEQTGYQPTPQDCRVIDKAVKTGETLSDLDLPKHLKEQLYNWTGDGRYAHLFDNRHNTFEVAEVQTTDFQGVSDKVIGPLFFYQFFLTSQVIYDPQHLARPKLVLADEIWKFLSAPAARAYFIESLKTFRKYNAGIGLLTQSALDLERAELLDCVRELCPMLMLLATPGANRDWYRRTFNMNERELDLFAGLIPKRQWLVLTPTWSKVLNAHVDGLSRLYYSNDPHTNLLRRDAQKEFGDDEGLLRLARGA